MNVQMSYNFTRILPKIGSSTSEKIYISTSKNDLIQQKKLVSMEWVTHQVRGQVVLMGTMLLTPSMPMDNFNHLITKNKILPRIRIYWDN